MSRQPLWKYGYIGGVCLLVAGTIGIVLLVGMFYGAWSW
jgi:hypothetical protein